MTQIGALVLALLVDRLLGEPPNALHPVVWMGKVTTLLMRGAPRRGAGVQLAYGAFVAVVVPLGFAAASAVLLAALAGWPLAAFVVTVAMLKPMFAVRALDRAAAVVGDALAAGDVGKARHGLRSLCSRDPERLGPPLLVAATVESLAENSSDSVVAPLLYYACFGVPGIVAYRASNTLDAMIGYHGKYEYLGKVAARIDDVLNLIPARVTAGLLLIAGWWCGQDARRGWRVLLRDGGKTESPNAGRPMAAMAGLLGVELEKLGYYRLGDPQLALEPSTIDAARKVVDRAALLAALVTALIIGGKYAI